MSETTTSVSLGVPNAEPRDGEKPPNYINIVAPGYFGTVGIPLVEGRLFTDQDNAAAAKVAIVNQRFVDYYWPGQPATGRRIDQGRSKGIEIVGVVRTAKYRTVREDPQITVYFPIAQRTVTQLTLHARVQGDIDGVAAKLTAVVRDIDPAVPVSLVATLADVVNARLANDRVLNVLATLFGGLALVISVAGLYGLVASSTARRRREVGIRMAIGASRGAILELFVTNILVLVGIGIAGGIPLALLVSRQFASVLYGIEPSSPTTLASAAGILAVVAILAATLPAWRAATVSPVAALRDP
jgi:ABC-type antimicrobial peptide transport system permease subunit